MSALTEFAALTNVTAGRVQADPGATVTARSNASPGGESRSRPSRWSARINDLRPGINLEGNEIVRVAGELVAAGCRSGGAKRVAAGERSKDRLDEA
jgi:hypothetical protein